MVSHHLLIHDLNWRFAKLYVDSDDVTRKSVNQKIFGDILACKFCAATNSKGSESLRILFCVADSSQSLGNLKLDVYDVDHAQTFVLVQPSSGGNLNVEPQKIRPTAIGINRDKYDRSRPDWHLQH